MAYSGIHIKPSAVGSLHRLLGVPAKSKIPAGDLTSKPGDSAAMRKKKNFARNARHFSHKGVGGLHKLMGG